ncbi:hypothetical protein JXA63_02275 [Candidatus Woesebacteria bacterium]|nr:hypothetical protein [Candidatus Woesebacteria bacterium]
MPKIPFLSTPDKPLSNSTQNMLPIADITEDIVVFKNGGAALIMESTSLNFGLLSIREQEAVIAAYAGLLNSFSFPVEIMVRSQKKDISNYIKELERSEKEITNPKLQVIMSDYKKFIVDAIKKKNVLSKKFYISIPFTPYELGVAKSFASTMNPGASSKPLPFPKSYVIRKAKITLYPKRDHLMRQMGRLGIMLRHLKNKDLVEVLYNTYNSEPPVKERQIYQ